MDLFTQNEIMLMIGVVGVLLLSIIVLAIFDYADRRKEKKKMVVVSDESVEFGEKLDKVQVEEEKQEDAMVEVLELDDEIVISDIEEDLTESEIMPVIAEVEEEPIQVVEEKKIDVEAEINKALQTMPKEDAITNFELEQERTAIISLDELMQKSNDLYNSNEIAQYDDGDEPISINEVMSRFKEKEEKSVPEIMQDIVEDSNSSLSFENTATFEKLNRETKKDFVTKLREASENK